MSGATVWTQVDAGVASTLGAIVVTAATRKLQRPRVFASTLQRLDPALEARPAVARRAAIAIAAYELAVGSGVIAFRGVAGFAFACGLLVACAAFLLALARAVQRSVPCACFGRLGRTAAGGRETGRAIVLVAGAAFLVVHRALDARPGYGYGFVAAIAAVVMVLSIVLAQRVGARMRPGIEVGPGVRHGRFSLGEAVRDITGYDNELYSIDS